MHCFNAFLNETSEVSGLICIPTHNFVGYYDYAHFEHIENNHEKYRAIAHDGIYT